MNILQVIPYYAPAYAFGGPVKVAYSISKELAKRGNNVTVYTTDVRSQNERLNDSGIVNVEGVEVHYLKNISLLPIKASNLFLTPQLIPLCRCELTKFDIIHLHEYTTYQNIVASYYARKYGVPYVLQAHGSIAINGRKGRKLVFNTLFGKGIIKNACKVIALSFAEQRQYKSNGLPDGKVMVIPNGLDLDEFDNIGKSLFKKRFCLPESTKIVLFVGRIHSIKGLDTLILAFRKITEDMNNVVLVLAGPDDGQLSELKSLAKHLNLKGLVLFVGPLYGEEKREAFADAEIFVLPSKYEMFPISLLEAFAYGKAVVCSKIPGLQQLVSDGENGLLFEQGNVNQLSDRLLFLLNNNSLCRQMGLNAQKYVMKNLTIEKTVNELSNLYQEIARK